MSVFNIIVLMPIYATGDPKDPNIVLNSETGQTISLLLITILNASGN